MKGFCERVWRGEGWPEAGVPLSPILFNLMLVDLEKAMRGKGWGGIKLGEEKVYTLACADDLVLIAEDTGGIKEMMARL